MTTFYTIISKDETALCCKTIGGAHLKLVSTVHILAKMKRIQAALPHRSTFILKLEKGSLGLKRCGE